ncbi:MAG: hypothetical protein ABI743_13205, partial [bacterium]
MASSAIPFLFPSTPLWVAENGGWVSVEGATLHHSKADILGIAGNGDDPRVVALDVSASDILCRVATVPIPNDVDDYGDALAASNTASSWDYRVVTRPSGFVFSSVVTIGFSKSAHVVWSRMALPVNNGDLEKEDTTLSAEDFATAVQLLLLADGGLFVLVGADTGVKTVEAGRRLCSYEP